MKYLCGSQSFGYNTEESDFDWVELVYPTWDDLVFNRTRHEKLELENGILKYTDIREIVKWFNRPNLSDMQFMFSQEYIGDDIDEFKWFFENRERLIRANLLGLFKHTSSTIKNNATAMLPKTMTRAAVYLDILRKISEGAKVEELRDAKYRKILERYKTLSLEELIDERDTILENLNKLETTYRVYEGQEDTEIISELKSVIMKMVKNHVE